MIPISLEEVEKQADFESELDNTLDLPNHARAFLYLAVKFVNEGVAEIHTMDVAEAIRKPRPYVHEILHRFTSLGVLEHKKEGRLVKYSPLDTGVFETYWKKAKQTLDDGRTETNQVIEQASD